MYTPTFKNIDENRYMVVDVTVRLSKMYGMDIFTDTGKFIGSAQNFLINVESGEVVRILLDDLPTSKDELKKVIREKSILYKNVKSVEDVIVVTKGTTMGER